MKMPAPPPPPPMAPGAPPPPVFKMPKSNPNDRDALLKSIRKGAKLKKTVTNDRSAPAVAGGVKNSSVKNNNNNNDGVISSSPSPMRNFSNIQLELKKQLANHDNRSRGPPPPAPSRNFSAELSTPRQPLSSRENTPNGIHSSQQSLNAVSSGGIQANPSSLHRKAKSNANLSTFEIADDSGSTHSAKPTFSSGKPNLAPKPPVLNGKPSLMAKGGKPVSRAHSLRTPRSPSPDPSTTEGNNGFAKFGTVRHMSSIIGPTLGATSPQNVRTRPALNSRPTAPPPSIPGSSPTGPLPPPPPSKVNAAVKPNHAPPPPPTSLPPPQPANSASPSPPPPPPHKTTSTANKGPPPPPQITSINPPPPPPRHSSIRDTSMRISVDLEEKFKELFAGMDKFPNPPPYRNVIKVYSSRQTQVKSGYVT
nr:unnamed protein product [Callosobruchus chinensis]